MLAAITFSMPNDKVVLRPALQRGASLLVAVHEPHLGTYGEC
jgi:hypothetical protein